MASTIIKWVGGKTRLLSQLDALLPPAAEIDHYAEPFVGGASMLFHIFKRWPEGKKMLFRLYANDSNEHLISFYRTVSDHPCSVADGAARLASAHNTKTYVQARALFNALRHWITSPQLRTKHAAIAHAAAFLYLNKCGFNGLYRENERGEFNVAPNKDAKWKPKLDELEGVLSEASGPLGLTCFSAKPFESFLDDQFALADGIISPERVFYFIDPPYLNAAQDGFTGYSGKGWSRADLMTLSMYVRKIHDEGGRFMMTHALTKLVAELFEHRDYNFTQVLTRSSVSTNAAGRTPVTELVIRNYK